MADHFKNYPWENHPLGPMELWPQSLKSAVSAALAAPYPVRYGRHSLCRITDLVMFVVGGVVGTRAQPRIQRCLCCHVRHQASGIIRQGRENRHVIFFLRV